VEGQILVLLQLLIATGLWNVTQPAPATPDVDDIVSRSVANNQTDWKAAPQFSYTERDSIFKGGERTDKTYKVLMIDGSPYNEPVAVNGKDLTAGRKEREDQKLETETQRRLHESPSARASRIARYENERRQDHMLMREMIAGFVFKLDGTETVSGRQCFKVEASPRPGYVPKSRETKVLKGMRGTLWIDQTSYQWVRVEASVFRPVAFGLFIAKVQPGTMFILEEAPVEANLWMPSRFETRVNATILFWSHRSVEEDAYSDYRRTPQAR
jgi:hypothetical protein